MSRFRGSVCKLCRREGSKLFLKGARCYTDKCAIDRRAYAPGQHGQSRSKISNYGLHLREKQKIRRLYGVQEKQFHSYFVEADRIKGVTGSNLLILLEKRLDNIVYRMGFSSSRAEARQLVRHGHVLVNGNRVDIPSYSVKAGDVISLKEKSRDIARVKDSVSNAEARGIPAWLELNQNDYTGVVKAIPVRDDLPTPLQEQLVVEYYSR
ncbi:MAG: 30S ribosomal protein S4 [Bdellovibrionales bacterium]|nr:30S ribosomal protein S4 [Bdellovibrionales bacterium]